MNPQKNDSMEETVEKIIERVVRKELRPLKEQIGRMVNEREYTVKEVAEIMNVNILTVRRWIKENHIGYVKAGTSYRITQKQLDEYRKVYNR